MVAGTEPDCANDEAVDCAPVKQNAKTPGIWNPLPYFDTVRADGQLGNIQSVQNFYAAAAAGSRGRGADYLVRHSAGGVVDRPVR